MAKMNESIRSARTRRRRTVATVPLVVAGVLAPGGLVSADETDPVAGSGPSSAGMPGGELVEQLIGWGQWLGIAACALAIIYGAATWIGFGSASAGRAMSGKTYVFGGGAGLIILGLLPTIVSMLFDVGRS